MLGLIFQFGGEIVETRIDGCSVFFRTSSYGSQFVPIENLHLSKDGTVKEYPDLENDPEWRVKAIQRFKEEMKKLKNENAIGEYILKDLQKFGYVPKYRQRQGHRVEVIHV